MISANDGQAIPTPQERADRLTETLRMAVPMADEMARSDIESFARGLGDRWYDIAPHDADDDYERMALARAAKYLSLREQLEVDPVDPQRVRVRA